MIYREGDAEVARVIAASTKSDRCAVQSASGPLTQFLFEVRACKIRDAPLLVRPLGLWEGPGSDNEKSAQFRVRLRAASNVSSWKPAQ